MKDKQKYNNINPPVKKKHILILEECERQLAANKKYCEQNNCDASEYMLGENEVLSNLIIFINKL